MSYDYRQLERNGRCKCCGRKIERHTEKIISFWATRDHVIICTSCIRDMSNDVGAASLTEGNKDDNR